jgi:hypothetical protein
MQSTLPHPWTEKEGGFYNPRDSVALREHPCAALLREELFAKKTAMPSDLTVTSHDIVSEADDEAFQSEHDETFDALDRFESKHDSPEIESKVYTSREVAEAVVKPKPEFELKEKQVDNVYENANPKEKRTTIQAMEEKVDSNIPIVEQNPVGSLSKDETKIEHHQEQQERFDEILKEELKRQSEMYNKKIEEMNERQSKEMKEIHEKISNTKSGQSEQDTTMLELLTEKLNISTKLFDELQGQFSENYHSFIKEREDALRLQEKAGFEREEHLKKEQQALADERQKVGCFK